MAVGAVCFGAYADDFQARQTTLDARTVAMTARYVEAQRACYKRFWVNYCLDQARKVMRAEKAAIRDGALLLHADERAARARRRERQRADRQAQSPVSAGSQRNATQRSGGQSSHKKQRASPVQPKRVITPAQAAMEAAQRAENVRRFKAKQSAAVQHKAAVERRKQSRRQKEKSRTLSD